MVVTINPLKVQNPDPTSKWAWSKPPTGAHAIPWSSAWRTGASIAPEVYGSERAASFEKLLNPLGMRPSSTPLTFGMWARARSRG